MRPRPCRVPPRAKRATTRPDRSVGIYSPPPGTGEREQIPGPEERAQRSRYSSRRGCISVAGRTRAGYDCRGIVKRWSIDGVARPDAPGGPRWQRMGRLVLMVSVSAFCPRVTPGDVVHLKDGTQLEGDIRKSSDGWTVLGADGRERLVPGPEGRIDRGQAQGRRRRRRRATRLAPPGRAEFYRHQAGPVPLQVVHRSERRHARSPRRPRPTRPPGRTGWTAAWSRWATSG